ncbi:OLC1v1007955C1 [Oldenlandia corymbosa var. corymbosa]|uniref:OLC1v1007955C1 n=1 Tax=Oldenlandia corymbosa var. corymbosa TaxID=529605 RepID=A0AAV1DKF3_OLDCO|nr:OLC1v1007955C1 [Oldenlandia corymbosa var. corymbosa]
MAELLVPEMLQFLAKVNTVFGVEEDLREIYNMYETLEQMAHEAEKRKLKRKLKDDAVRVWLGDVEDVVYEMKNLLEIWNTSIVKMNDFDKRKSDRRVPTCCWEKVRSIFSSSVTKVPVLGDLTLKIKETHDKLETILRDANRFKFESSSTTEHSSSNEFSNPSDQSILNRSEAEYDCCEVEVEGELVEQVSVKPEASEVEELGEGIRIGPMETGLGCEENNGEGEGGEGAD